MPLVGLFHICTLRRPRHRWVNNYKMYSIGISFCGLFHDAVSRAYYYYYYYYSSLGLVWAGTRAQSGDRYGTGTLHPGQVLRASLPLLSPISGYIAWLYDDIWLYEYMDYSRYCPWICLDSLRKKYGVSTDSNLASPEYMSIALNVCTVFIDSPYGSRTHIYEHRWSFISHCNVHC